MGLVPLLAVALTLAGAAEAGVEVLRATVVAETSVSLVDASGAAVSHLAPGAYTIVVDDRSSTDNFHLSGPGVNLDSGLRFTGQGTWQVTLGDGPYSFVSDPAPASCAGRSRSARCRRSGCARL